MRATELCPAKHLEAADLGDEVQVVTITGVEIGEVGEDKVRKGIVNFKEFGRGLVAEPNQSETDYQIARRRDGRLGWETSLPVPKRNGVRWQHGRLHSREGATCQVTRHRHPQSKLVASTIRRWSFNLRSTARRTGCRTASRASVRYVTRHRNKNGREDIEKAIHCLELLLEMEYPV